MPFSKQRRVLGREGKIEGGSVGQTLSMQGASEVSKPILCLDFDGVIHSYASGWKGADVIPDDPVPDAFAFIREALDHFRVAVYSSRSNQPGGIKAMQRWFERYLPSSGATNWWLAIEWPTEKPPAFLTIDDRALTFEGTWPAIETLKSFQPWNKRT